jgi:hypothetical protein
MLSGCSRPATAQHDPFGVEDEGEQDADYQFAKRMAHDMKAALLARHRARKLQAQASRRFPTKQHDLPENQQDEEQQQQQQGEHALEATRASDVQSEGACRISASCVDAISAAGGTSANGGMRVSITTLRSLSGVARTSLTGAASSAVTGYTSSTLRARQNALARAKKTASDTSASSLACSGTNAVLPPPRQHYLALLVVQIPPIQRSPPTCQHLACDAGHSTCPGVP